jgi:hypothetical protein
MLTLFVKLTNEPNKSVEKTLNSLSGLYDDVYFIDNMIEINDYRKENSWYLVLYDNEFVNIDLKNAISSILKMEVGLDAVIFLEVYPDGTMFQSPRMFKKYVILKKDCLMPLSKFSNLERILDGWIKKHAC